METAMKQTVLIIDDSIFVCEQIKKILKEEDLLIREAHSGEEAEKELSECVPDLILLDIVLPDIEGYELFKKIKEEYQYNAAIIFITSKGDDEDIVKGFSLGACDYIKKPFGPAEVKSRIKLHLTDKRQKDELAKANRELQNNMERLNYMAFRDGLTGLYNRRYVKDDLLKDIQVQDPGSVGNFIIMADVDNFKGINDQYGHEAGDEVLVYISNIMEDICRRHKVIRWGGEEFMIVLFSVTENEAFGISESIRKEVETFKVSYQDNVFSCTITLGLCHYDESLTLDGNIERADQALYIGKRSGKNRSVWYEEEIEETEAQVEEIEEAEMDDELL